MSVRKLGGWTYHYSRSWMQFDDPLPDAIYLLEVVERRLDLVSSEKVKGLRRLYLRFQGQT